MRADVLQVYFIMGTMNCIHDPLLTLEEALEAGITCFQLREKGEGALTDEAYEAFARSCQTLCRAYQVPFIINDDVSLALRLDADGIHVGQDDLALSQFREQAAGKIVGVSVHNAQDMEAAIRAGADYVGIGPIYATRSKHDAKPPAGLHFLQAMRAQYCNYPIVGIGGITEDNACDVRKAGADGVAVISVICESDSRMRTINSLRAIAK